MKKIKSSKSNEEGINERLDRVIIALERIANVLESGKALPEGEDEEMDENEEKGQINIGFERPVSEVPSEIKFATAEELAAQMIDFAKKEFPDEERVYIRSVSQLFWGQKNISKWNMPPEIQFKIEKAEMLAQKKLDVEKEFKNKSQLEKEKTELPSLVSSCVDWAKDHGLKRITQADVDAFLLEKNIELMSQTKRSLYAMANVTIRSKL
jgi:hypothetical protein